VRAFALVELGDDFAIDFFIRSEGASAALEDCTSDEPDWIELLYVAPIELHERDVSAN
jgi:hypothetical protein